MTTRTPSLFLAQPPRHGSGCDLDPVAAREDARPPARPLMPPRPGRCSWRVERSALGVGRWAFSVLSLLLAAPLLASASWRTYAVYQPRIERAVVVEAAEQPLRYNHDSSVAWFRDRWFCVWNANTVPAEGAPGQLNYVSTSRDGLNWSAPQPVFSDHSLSANPIPCPKGTQWQPNLLVVGERLWCIWSQNSKDAHNGCYFSTLDAPDGLWTNRLLTWNGQADPVIDDHPHRLFPTQNPSRLSTGRVLAPITTIGPASTNPAAGKNSWYGREKRNSVIYTDDEGLTWHVSPGTMLPGLEWRQWEPTVWEQPDGSVLMFARNNFIPAFENTVIRSDETLTWSRSRDRGATWTPHAFVPLETVVSRMHVMRQPDSDRYLMLHNDWLSGRFGVDRRNMALFINRGGGINFTAGVGLTDNEPEVAYPQMDIRGEALLFVYSQGPCSLRNIRSVRLSNLPEADKYYIYPRNNLPPPPLCVITNNALLLRGGFALKCRTVPAVNPHKVNLAAEINHECDGTLFDNRDPQGGFVWGISGTLFVHLGEPTKNLRSTLPVRPGHWTRAGVMIDYPKGEVVFSVNDQSERVAFKPGKRSLTGHSATLLGPNPPTSTLTPFEGKIRNLTIDGVNQLEDALNDTRLTNLFEIVRPPHPSEAVLARHLTQSVRIDSHVQHLHLDGKDLLRLSGQASAGIELDANHRADNDAVELEFSFRLEQGTSGTICTVGDTLQPARLAVQGSDIVLISGGNVNVCGKALTGDWQKLSVFTQKNLTRVKLDTNAAAETRHTPQATWLYFGEGYLADATPSDIVFSVDTKSVRSRIRRAAD